MIIEMIIDWLMD